jgi:hypothetical protein
MCIFVKSFKSNKQLKALTLNVQRVVKFSHADKVIKAESIWAMKVTTSDYPYDSANKGHTDTTMALGNDSAYIEILCKIEDAKEHSHRDPLVTPRVGHSKRTDDESIVAEQTMNTHFRQHYFIMIDK